MEKKTKIWLLVAIVICALTTCMNVVEARWISVVLAIVAIIGLIELLLRNDNRGFYLTCICYIFSFIYSVISSIGSSQMIIYIVMSFVGSVFIPGITAMFLVKDKILRR